MLNFKTSKVFIIVFIIFITNKINQVYRKLIDLSIIYPNDGHVDFCDSPTRSSNGQFQKSEVMIKRSESEQQKKSNINQPNTSSEIEQLRRKTIVKNRVRIIEANKSKRVTIVTPICQKQEPQSLKPFENDENVSQVNSFVVIEEIKDENCDELKQIKNISRELKPESNRHINNKNKFQSHNAIINVYIEDSKVPIIESNSDLLISKSCTASSSWQKEQQTELKTRKVQSNLRIEKKQGLVSFNRKTSGIHLSKDKDISDVKSKNNNTKLFKVVAKKINYNDDSNEYESIEEFERLLTLVTGCSKLDLLSVQRDRQRISRLLRHLGREVLKAQLKTKYLLTRIMQSDFEVQMMRIQRVGSGSDDDNSSDDNSDNNNSYNNNNMARLLFRISECKQTIRQLLSLVSLSAKAANLLRDMGAISGERPF